MRLNQFSILSSRAALPSRVAEPRTLPSRDRQGAVSFLLLLFLLPRLGGLGCGDDFLSLQRR
jgi:hypothetical protein